MAIYLIHQNDRVGMQFRQAVRLNDFLARTKYKATRLTGLMSTTCKMTEPAGSTIFQNVVAFAPAPHATTRCPLAFNYSRRTSQLATRALKAASKARPSAAVVALLSIGDGAVRWRGRLYCEKLAAKTLLNVTYLKSAHGEQLGERAWCEVGGDRGK